MLAAEQLSQPSQLSSCSLLLLRLQTMLKGMFAFLPTHYTHTYALHPRKRIYSQWAKGTRECAFSCSSLKHMLTHRTTTAYSAASIQGSARVVDGDTLYIGQASVFVNLLLL